MHIRSPSRSGLGAGGITRFISGKLVCPASKRLSAILRCSNMSSDTLTQFDSPMSTTEAPRWVMPFPNFWGVFWRLEWILSRLIQPWLMSSAVSFPRKAGRASKKKIYCLSPFPQPPLSFFQAGAWDWGILQSGCWGKSISLSCVIEKLCNCSRSLFMPIIGQQWHHCKCLPRETLHFQPAQGPGTCTLASDKEESVSCPCAHLLYQECEFSFCSIRFHLSLLLKLIVFFSLSNPLEKLHNNASTSQSSLGGYIC